MYLISKKVLYVILAAIAGIIVTAVICNAESAIVSFNDAEQLAAISDSIVGVCDTVVMTITRMEEGHSAIADSFRFVLDTVGTTITCRELVCRTAEWPKMEWKWVRREGNYPEIYLEWKEIDIPMEWREVFIPGAAIITWREVK